MHKSPSSLVAGDTEKNRFRQQLRELFESTDTSFAEFARLLEAESRVPVNPARLSAWVKGKNSPINSDVRYALLTGARQVVRLLKLAPQPQARAREAARWISGAQAREQIEQWLTQGLSFRQIAVAGQLSETQLALWREGVVTRVDRPRFERAKLLIEYWRDLLRDSGALDWASAAEVSEQLREWRKIGLTDDELQAAAEIPPTLFSRWQEEAAVPAVHFKKVQLMINHWLQVRAAREAGAPLPPVQKRHKLARPKK